MPTPELENLSAVDMNAVYLIIGTLVVMNVGAIGGGFVFLVKMAWRASKYDSRIIKMENDLHAAHNKIRELEHKDEV